MYSDAHWQPLALPDSFSLRSGWLFIQGKVHPRQPRGETRLRWQCRQGQIAAAKDLSNHMPPGPERSKLDAAINRFERNNVAVEHARLSDAVYRPGEAPTGWNNISNDPQALARYGLTPQDLQKPGSNFGAQMYEPDPAVFGTDIPDGQSKFPHLWPPQIPPGKTGRIMTTRC